MLTKKQIIDTIKDFFHENPDNKYFMQLKLREQLSLASSKQLELILDELESEEFIAIKGKGSLRPGIMKGQNFN